MVSEPLLDLLVRSCLVRGRPLTPRLGCLADHRLEGGPHDVAIAMDVHLESLRGPPALVLDRGGVGASPNGVGASSATETMVGHALTERGRQSDERLAVAAPLTTGRHHNATTTLPPDQRDNRRQGGTSGRQE